jgi:hypothetical protein
VEATRPLVHRPLARLSIGHSPACPFLVSMLFFLLCTFMHQCDRYSIMGSTCQFKEHVRYSGRRTRVEPGQVMHRPVRLYLAPITLSKWIGWTIPVRARLSHRRSLSTKLDRRRLLVINGHPMSPHEKVEWPTPATTCPSTIRKGITRFREKCHEVA